MTYAESLMLAVCFGAVMGSFIGDISILIKFAVENHREKKRRCAEEAARKEASEE